jgi:ATP-dependent Clp protease protease subunit
MKLNKLMQLLKDNAHAEGPAAIRMDATDTEAHLYVSDVIDSFWGASAEALITALASAADKTVHLHINSPGGDVFEARAMAAAVVAHPKDVIAHIDGMCASAATYLALACSQVRMTEGGLFMIHNSWTFTYGDKHELIETADLLDKIDGTIVADYARKTGASTDQVVAWMDATTWFTAQEALDAKFIDAIDPNTKQSKAAASAQAHWNLSAYPNAPKQEEKTPEPDLTALAQAHVQRNKNRLRLVEKI